MLNRASIRLWPAPQGNNIALNKGAIKQKLPTANQVSAGGVVFRQENGSVEIVICKIVPEMRWQLPKGLVDAGESAEKAALREVREEAGVLAEIIAQVDSIEYWYIGDYGEGRTRYHKLVHFYLMRYVSGDVADHDNEVDEATWKPIEKAIDMLAFENEKDIVEKARKLISEAAGD